MTVDEMVPKVREALAVSSSYDAVTIPAGIRRTMKRLLRDFNFPKSVKRFVTSDGDIFAGKDTYSVPPGLKRPLELRWLNTNDITWSDPLVRHESLVLPSREFGLPRRYWLEGDYFRTDAKLDATLAIPGLQLIMWYQSMALDTATETWMLDDLEDLIFTRSVFRLATELRKTEVAQVFAQLVPEDTQSIAIYANELEWHGVETIMREPRGLSSERYPA